MKKPLVSIIIVNLNGEKVLFDCLSSLAKVKYKNYEIILVDNGSNAEEIEKLKEIKSIKLILNNENLGFAPANNQGIKLAKGRYILLLNNDTTVHPNFLEKMVKKMEADKRIGAMQPKIYLMDKKNYLDNCGAFLNTLGFTDHWGYDKKDSSEFDKEREVFSVKGACLFTRRMIIEKIGLFDDDFVSYYEESDFCWRVWLGGWRCVYFPQTYIYHKAGFTSKNLPVFDVNFHSLKNRICSFIKNFEVGNLIIYLSLHFFALLLLAVVYVSKLKFSKLIMIVSATWWNIINLSDTLKKRKKVQKMRVKKDIEILPVIMHRVDFGKLIAHFFATEKNFNAK